MTISTSAFHGTTCSISSRNSRFGVSGFSQRQRLDGCESHAFSRIRRPRHPGASFLVPDNLESSSPARKLLASIRAGFLEFIMLKLRHLFAATALLAVAAHASAAGNFSAKTTTATYLPGGPGWVEVVSIHIPAGTWVVHSLAPAVNFNGTDILRCQLTVDGVQVSQSSAMMGGGGGMPAASPVP